MLDLSPEGKFRSQSWHRRKLPQTKYAAQKKIPISKLITFIHRLIQDSKRNITLQLAEVQAKLISLKNRVWLGTGSGEPDQPLSWGATNFSVPNSAPPQAK